MQESLEIETLTKLLSRFPGLGPRSARRMILFMLEQKEGLMLPLSSAIERAAEAISSCTTCGNFDTQNPCTLCQDTRRDRSKICVVETVSDIWAIERTGSFKGLYHVLGGLLSALDGIRPTDLAIHQLIERMDNDDACKEVILALSATVDGQSTAHYIHSLLKNKNVDVTKLAHGVPVGGELDYLDEGTLSLALKSRNKA